MVVGISGGQAQRLSYSKSIFKKKDLFLILDEATSSLDMERLKYKVIKKINKFTRA